MTFNEFVSQVLDACPAGGMHAVAVLRLRDIDQLRIDNGLRWALDMPSHVEGELRRVLRPQDRVLRMAEDAFALVLPSLRNRGHATLAISRLQRALEHELIIDGMIAPVLSAAGVVALDGPGMPIELALQLADRAALMARREGLSCAFHTEAVEAPSFKLTDLRKAIQLNRLEVELQPLIDLETGHVVGVESLARWRIDGKQVFRPDQFVAAAENSGLIGEFTRWSFNASLRSFAELRKTYPDLHLAFNLSPRAFIDDDIELQIVGALRLWDVPPESLTLEVTEGAVMRDPERGILFLQRFHDAGMRVSIDDFGCGHSSFSYLQRFPARELKIDQSFIRSMAGNRRTTQLVDSMIHLAHNLGLEVVAEGIEDAQTLKLLIDLGADIGQGFLIARPMPLAQCMDWIGEQNAQAKH